MNLNDASKLPVNELGSVPRFGSAEEAQDYLTQRGVKYVLAQFVDIHGVAKAKSVPVAHLKGVLKAGAGFAGFAIWGVGIEPNGPDYMAVGDLSTLTPVLGRTVSRESSATATSTGSRGHTTRASR